MPYHVLSSRDRQILKDGLARLRTMPPTETWRTQRQIFGGGSGGRAVIIADALEDVSTGLSGSFRRQKGPLGGLTDDDVGMGGGMGGFDSGFDSGFDTSSPPEIDAWNICDAPIWTGARCVLAWCVLPHGSLPKSGWVVVESNSATRIRATTPGGGVTAGNSGTFTGVVPLDGVYDPTSASIYLPTGATNLDAGDRVCADWNYLNARWEAQPDRTGAGLTQLITYYELQIANTTISPVATLVNTELFDINLNDTSFSLNATEYIATYTNPTPGVYMVFFNVSQVLFGTSGNAQVLRVTSQWMKQNVIEWAVGQSITSGDFRVSTTDDKIYYATSTGTTAGDDTDLAGGSDTGVTWIYSDNNLSVEYELDTRLNTTANASDHHYSTNIFIGYSELSQNDRIGVRGIVVFEDPSGLSVDIGGKLLFIRVSDL